MAPRDNGHVARMAKIDKPKGRGNPRMGWASDAMAEMVRRLDLKYISLTPGASYRGFHDSLVNFLGNENPKMLVCLHEEHAVALAHGYAKVTETPMAVALHSNVGLMHAVMAIFNGWTDRKPMIIFGATGPVDANERRPWIDWIHTSKDQASMIRQFIKWDDQPASVPAALESILRANQITRTPPYGPVYVCLDAELQEQALSGPVTFPDHTRYAPAPPSAPSPESVAEAANLLAKAKRPLILMGRVSRRQDDWNRRVQLAEATGAMVLTSTRSAAAFPTSHPQHVAPPSSRATEPIKQVIKAADVILNMDYVDVAGLFQQVFGEDKLKVKAKIIHCSPDSYVHNGWTMDHQALPLADVPIQTTPDALVKALLPAIKKKIKSKASVANKYKLRVKKLNVPMKVVKGRKTMGLRDLALTIRDFRKGNKVSMVQLSLGWPGETCDFNGPLDYFGIDGGGGVGAGPGISVGVALALQGTGMLPLTVLGDGDFMMGCNALWTASHMEIPLLVVIANNRSYYNDEAHQERMAIARKRPVGNKWIGQRIDDPPIDLVAIAKAQGFDGEGPVSRAEDFALALKRGEKVVRAGGRYVIETRIDPGYADEPIVYKPRSGS